MTATTPKKFKQVSTGLILSCSREDVIAQYEKYPDLYIPVTKEPEKTEKAKKPAETAQKTTETEKK